MDIYEIKIEMSKCSDHSYYAMNCDISMFLPIKSRINEIKDDRCLNDANWSFHFIKTQMKGKLLKTYKTFVKKKTKFKKNSYIYNQLKINSEQMLLRICFEVHLWWYVFHNEYNANRKYEPHLLATA